MKKYGSLLRVTGDHCRLESIIILSIITDGIHGKANNQGSPTVAWVFMYGACYFYPVLTKLEVSWQILLTPAPNIKFQENLSIESRVVPCGGTDGQT
jgi:hypothetical protein